MWRYRQRDERERERGSERREETQADMRKQPLLDDAKTKHITGKPKTSNKLAL